MVAAADERGEYSARPDQTARSVCLSSCLLPSPVSPAQLAVCLHATWRSHQPSRRRSRSGSAGAGVTRHGLRSLLWRAEVTRRGARLPRTCWRLRWAGPSTSPPSGCHMPCWRPINTGPAAAPPGRWRNRFRHGQGRPFGRTLTWRWDMTDCLPLAVVDSSQRWRRRFAPSWPSATSGLYFGTLWTLC